jgi:hypothetical protein
VKERKENSCPVIPLLTMHSYERNLLTNGGRIGLSVSISLPTSGKSSNWSWKKIQVFSIFQFFTYFVIPYC